VVTRSPAARRERLSILLVNDEPALGDAIKAYLTKAIEVIPVHDSAAALGVLEVRRGADLLVTEIAIPEATPRSVALMVRPLVRGVGFVFMTGRPQLIDTGGVMRDKACVQPVILADLAQEIRRRLDD
jgi:DNA-binding response OmpR family regulator